MEKFIMQNTINSIITGYNVMRKKGLKSLKSCVTLSDKLKWLAIFDNNDLKVKCADKIKAKEYVREKLGIDISVPILKIYDNVDQINIDELPDKFIIKANHGSGKQFYEIVNNKNNVNLDNLKNKFQKSLNIDYSCAGGELFYHFINRKIFAEELIDEEFLDYKVYCCNNNIMIIKNVYYVNGITESIYDVNGIPLDYAKGNIIKKAQKPIDKNLVSKLVEYSKILSKDFKFVRCDFIVTKNKIYFGELTFIPASGRDTFYTKELDLWLGKHLIINV